MTVRLDGDVIFLEGQCHVEQAEELLLRLHEVPGRVVNLTGCRHLHSALVQLLLSHAVQVSGEPSDSFLRQFVTPHFKAPEIST